MSQARILTRSILAASAALACVLAAAPSAHAQAQRMVIPAYFDAGPTWTRMESGAPTVGIAILNPDSGPGMSARPSLVSQVKAAQAAGLTVIGYVDTGYAARPTRTVEIETRLYFKWYHVDGIFYDDVTNTSANVGYYKRLYAFVKSMRPKAMVMINPGTQVTQDYMSACDIVCNFESGYNSYLTQYSAPQWVSTYPARRFYQIILDVPSVADMESVVRMSKHRHAGWVFVTSLSTPNPYYDLPPEPYWSDELKALASPNSD